MVDFRRESTTPGGILKVIWLSLHFLEPRFWIKVRLFEILRTMIISSNNHVDNQHRVGANYGTHVTLELTHSRTKVALDWGRANGLKLTLVNNNQRSFFLSFINK